VFLRWGGDALYPRLMAKVVFSKSIVTSRYGQVTAGDSVEVSDEDAARYVRAGWATAPPAPKKSAGKRAAGRSSVAAPDMVAEVD